LAVLTILDFHRFSVFHKG